MGVEQEVVSLEFRASRAQQGDISADERAAFKLEQVRGYLALALVLSTVQACKPPSLSLVGSQGLLTHRSLPPPIFRQQLRRHSIA